MNEYKNQLIKEKQRLQESIKNNNESQKQSSVSIVDTLDFAANESSKFVLNVLKDRDLLMIKDIDKALLRCDQGTYGLCESCEEDIETKRLAARPWVSLCLKCQEIKDSPYRKFKNEPSKNVTFDELNDLNEDREEEAS